MMRCRLSICYTHPSGGRKVANRKGRSETYHPFYGGREESRNSENKIGRQVTSLWKSLSSLKVKYVKDECTWVREEKGEPPHDFVP
jgi:hypothetical protein